MRWYILRTLLHKEALRHLADRGGLGLAMLLVVAALLLSFFGQRGSRAGAGLIGGVERCYVDYWQAGPWLDHLRSNVPAELREQIRFRPAEQVPRVGDVLVYEPGTGAIQVRNAGPSWQVVLWHPGAEGVGLAPFEAWFWKETQTFFQTQSDGRIPPLEQQRMVLDGGLDPRAAIATSLVLFALFFACVYLMPSLTCEERERGVLLAQALSPASPGEILAAKFLFYPAVGVGLAALLAGLYSPPVLLMPFFWFALLAATFGSLGIGLTIASVARTQRAASMAALCYMMAVALILFVCQQNNIPGLPLFAVEYHGPRMLNAVLLDKVRWFHWGNLVAAGTLAFGWNVLAVWLFRRQGWQ